MKYTLPTIFLFFLLNFSLFAQQGDCPACTTSLPTLPEDTLFISELPVGTVGQNYTGELSFRMPKTTTPVNAIDPGTPAGLNINEINLLSINNIPAGLVWDTEQVTFEPDNETDGCISFCGTPLIAGTYDVGIVIAASVSLITQTAAFTFPIVIEPASSNTDGFALTNNIACGETTVDIQNNIPSNGNAGITYFWDFGNGNTTTAENPNPINYNEPGVYPIQYEAVIDTVGYILTHIEVKESGCTDLPSFPTFSTSPDMNIKVIAPNGDTIFQTPNYDNTSAPIDASCYIPLMDGNYQVEVIDDDGGLNFSDDECGVVTFNKYTIGDLFDGDLTVALTIIHPVDTITAQDSVVVYESPEQPLNIALSSTDICDGTAVVLETNYMNGLQWFQDSVPILDATESSYEVLEGGAYYVRYENEFGCPAFSESVEVELLELPAVPAYVNNENILTVFDLEMLPADYSLVWYQDGEIIPDENDISICIEVFGNYTLEVTDNETGCTNSFSTNVAYNPNFPCNSTSTNEFLETNITIAPNPFADYFTINMDNHIGANAAIRIWSATGELVYFKEEMINRQMEFQSNHWTNGVYILEIALEKGVIREMLVKQ